MDEKNTIKVVEIKTGLSDNSIRRISKRLNQDPHYTGGGNPSRYWTEAEIEAIRTWERGKPGRKKKC